MRENGSSLSSRGLAYGSLSTPRIANMRSKLKNREISERQQVGDTESMMNEEPASNMPGSGSEWLD